MVGNTDVLPPLAAALARGFNVDRLDKFPQSVGRKLLQILVFVCPLDELFQILNLSFLYFNILLQSLDFHFELRLFLLISPAHHRKPFIRNASCHIVLVDTDKQPIKFRQPLLCLCQTLPVSADGFLTGRPELLFRDLPEVLFIPCHIEDDRFHVHTDQLIQHNRSDEVCRTASRAAAVETYSKLCDWCCLRQQIASIAKSAGITAKRRKGCSALYGTK